MRRSTAVCCKMGNKKTNRKYDIAFLNILFCLMVIFIHISSETVVRADHTSTMFWSVCVLSRLCGFSVSGFVLLSGVKLMLKANKINILEFYKSRLISVVLPYIIWVCIYYGYFCWSENMSFSWLDLGHYILFGDLWAHFYFVVVIVQFYVLAPLWLFLFKRANPCVAVAVALVISLLSENIGEILQAFGIDAVWNTDIMFTKYLFCWTAGCMIGRYYGEFQQYLKHRWPAISLMFFIFTAAEAVLLVKTIGAEPHWMKLVYMLYTISAILFLYMSAQIFCGCRGFCQKALDTADKMTYHIYLIHCLVLVCVNDYMNQRGIYDLPARFCRQAILVYGISILLCFVWHILKPVLKKIINRA